MRSTRCDLGYISVPLESDSIEMQDHTNGSYNLYDPFTNALLGTSAVAPPSLPNATPNPKHRLIRLFDPDVEVHIWNQTGLSWSWTMDWEETQYVWTREVASLLGSDRAFTLSVVSSGETRLRSTRLTPSLPTRTASPTRTSRSYNTDRIVRATWSRY